MEVLEAIMARASKRAFLNRPVPKELVSQVLTAASRAPSGINLQPWEFTVVSGEERPRLSKALLKAYREKAVGCRPATLSPLPDRFKARQMSTFECLARALGQEGPAVAEFVNQGSLEFYGAPTAVIVTKDKALSDHNLTSVGLMVGYFLLAAESCGLATCPIGMINAYFEVVLEFINREDQDLVLGLALGYADPQASVNHIHTSRQPLEELVRWFG